MAFLAYNGKFLMRTGKWIGYSNVEPAPISGDGVIRFRFYNSDNPIDLEFLNELTRNEGQWVQVLDAITGLPIDGLWDYAYETYPNFRYNFPRLTPQVVNGADVDIVDIKESDHYADFWTDAFYSCTALRKVNITQLTGSSSAGHMFEGCNGLVEAHVECESLTTTEQMFYDCSSLYKLYVSTSDGLETNMFIGCTSLRELTIEWTGANDGYFMYDANSELRSASSLEEVTLIHPYNVTVTLSGHASYNVFKDLAHLRHVNHLVNNNGALEPDALPVSGQIERLFSGCTNLEAIPLLRATGSIQCSYAFDGCRSVGSGILAAYNVLAPVSGQYQHQFTFRNCGVDSSSGAAELAQIPSDWK